MTSDEIRNYCNSLKATTEDIKWKNDLCFSVGGKMYCAVSLVEPMYVSFKVTDEEFVELCDSGIFLPAPYAARHKWVITKELKNISKKNLLGYIHQSYELIKNKLSKKTLCSFN